jgi:hypothetical protein
MPFAHRFQSRFFQTIQSKFYQLQDRVQLHWRQLKMAVVWGTQLSLYPLHVAVQASRWSGRVLKQQITKRARSLTLALGLESVIEADQPIQNILAALDVQGLPVLIQVGQEPQLPTDSAQTKPWQISLRPAMSHKWSFVEKCSKLWQKWRGAGQQENAITPLSSDPGQTLGTPRSAAVMIQGVASSLCHRRLVLIAAENQVLDILNPEQQQLLHQRIIFEIAVALRMRRRLGVTSPRLPAPTLPLNPLKAAWIQLQQFVRPGFLSPSAPLQLLPGSETSSSSVIENWIENWVLPLIEKITPRLKALRGTMMGGISAIALAPFALALPAGATMAPALPQPLPAPLPVAWIADPVRTRKQWLKSADLFGQSKPTQGKIRLAPEKAPATLTSESFQTAIADWAYRVSQTIPSSGSPPIDVDAAFMGYHLHPLERLLVILDQIMAWLETQVLWLWRQGVSVIRNLFL